LRANQDLSCKRHGVLALELKVSELIGVIRLSDSLSARSF